ncbi:hypothetical protein KR222_001264 [Zaprionus bogoriensis]|nr:hypothetical protein KR222_001264 [Zaprionus bogoriensis]
MGKLKLYGIIRSPPVRAVKLTLAALELPYEFVVVDTQKKEQYSEEYLKKNPQHTVPMLEDDDACIWDSHAIIAYLVGKYGKDDSLYPKDLLKRAVVDQRLHFETGVVFANALRAITRQVAALSVTVVPKERLDAINEVYDFTEVFLKDHDFIAGNQLTIADFSIVSSITSLVAYLDIDAAKFPKLSAWLKRLEQLPYFSVNSEGANLFVSMIKSITFTFES